MKTITIKKIQYPVYATLKEADEYFNAVFGSNWETIDDGTKNVLLVSATRSIDYAEWKGVKVDEEQALAFPRYIAGKKTDDDLLMKACCEEAIAIYKSGSSNVSNTEGIQSIKVQDTQITFRANAEEQKFKSNAVEEILRPYMYLGVSVLF